jgi:arylsulfatase A-like enzyme
MFCLRAGLNIKVDHLLMFTGIVVLLAGAMWAASAKLFHLSITVQLRLAVLLCAALVSMFLTWQIRNKAERWMYIIQQRITPLVWLFCIWSIISVPIVAYHTLGKRPDKITLSQKIPSSPTTNKNRPNIILVTFDALTARDMFDYGYHIPTTPFISKWAEKASLFARTKAQSNITSPAVASLMTGKRMWTHQKYALLDYSKPIKNDTESLPFMLKTNGYFNMAFVVNPQASVEGLGINNHFDIAPRSSTFTTSSSLLSNIDNVLLRLFGYKIRMYDWIVKHDFILDRILRNIFIDGSKTVVPPEKAFNSFLKVIDKVSSEPFFAWIHLFPPHDPYVPAKPFMGMLDTSPELRTVKSHLNISRLVNATNISDQRYQHFLREFRPRIKTFRARYDEFIMYCDQQFEYLINQLSERDILKNTVVILSSDHGESFEHGYLLHGEDDLYEQATHIPLVIKEPNQIQGRINHDLVEQTDITATILDLAIIPIPEWMEGRSLVPFMRGNTLSAKPVFAMALSGNIQDQKITTGTIVVWEDNYKLIHNLEKGQSLLFNLGEDPGELERT